MARFTVTKIQDDLFRVWDRASTETIADYDNLAMAEAHAKAAQKSYEDYWKNRK